MIGMAIASVAMSVASATSSALAQKEQAKQQSKIAQYNADIANVNAEIATEAGRQEAREGYENAIKKRQEVAGIIGKQRAAGGASGAQVDTGSLLDVNLDTAEKGANDATALEQAGLDGQYQYDLQAWNHKQEADSYQAQADSLKKAGNDWSGVLLAASGSLISSGSNAYMNYSAANPSSGMGATKSTGKMGSIGSAVKGATSSYS